MITVASNLIVRPPSLTASTKISSHVPISLIHRSLIPMQQQQQVFSDSSKFSFMNTDNNNNEINYKHHMEDIQQQQQQQQQGNDFNYSQPHHPQDNNNNWSERILQDVIGLLHILSPTGKILYCSESCIELTGYHPQELIGKSLTDFLHTDDLDIFARNFQMAFSTLTRIKVHYRIRRKDHTYLLLESIGQPKQDVPDQPPQSFFAIAQPYLSRSNGLLDSFLELKMENEWLKKRLNDLMFIQQSPSSSPPPSSSAAATTTKNSSRYQQQASQYQLQQYHLNNNEMQYYLSSSTCFENSNNNELLIGTTTNDHPQQKQQQYFMNTSPQTSSSRRPSSCSSATKFQTNNNNNNNTTMADDNIINNNNHWNTTTTTYSPSVEFNEMLDRYQQEEQIEVGMTTSYLSSNNSNTTTTTTNTTMDTLLLLQQKDKWKRRKKHRGVDDYVCSDCGTTASPEWRKGPHGPKTLCNACGIRWAKKIKKI